MTEKRAVLYYRVSKDEQNCENQKSDLKRYCEFRGWGVAGEYQDDAISGLKVKRPALDAMMSEIRRGKFNILLVWSYDRLARNAAHLVMTLEELKNLKVDFASYRQQMDTTTPMGNMMFMVCAGMAQMERDMISERTRASLARLKSEGVKLGRPEADPKKIGWAIALREQKLSIRKIGLALDMSPAWVHKVLKGAA